LAEETHLRPKPMVEVGGKPILWHIMKIYEKHNFTDFILALGYKSDVIKDYFINYHARQSDLLIDLKNGNSQYNNPTSENWSVSLIDTGLNTMTGGRLLRLADTLKSNGTFMLTYGDGVSNVDLTKLLSFHRKHGKIATVTAVRPPVRFGSLDISDSNLVTNFHEKPQSLEGWINGGFFVFEPEIFEYIEGDQTLLERFPLEQLAKDNQLVAYKHSGYWQCMDTVRDKQYLEEICASGSPSWLND